VANNQTSTARIVSLDAIKTLVEGSHEHLGFVLDEALLDGRDIFTAGRSVDVTRMATFSDYMVVGTSDGQYFNVKFEHSDGGVVLLAPTKVAVPVVTSSNATKSVKDFTLSAVDALMSEGSPGVVGRILALADLQEQRQVWGARDYPAEAVAAVSDGRPWRQALAAQWGEISRQVVDKLESIRGVALEAKYKPMYESDDIPEEKFETYRPLAEADLNVLAGRLQSIHEAVESVYLPFRDSLSKSDLDESEEDVLSHFCFFSEDLIADLSEIRSLVADTLENEQCVMCLGQVYDTIAESLTDCEIAGSFVQRMAGALDDAA
jgi:hypothetical protein